jgi:hypothetical protein
VTKEALDMIQAMRGCEVVQNPQPMIFHEGQYDILDGLEDLDDIFGVREEETEPERKKEDVKNTNNKGIKIKKKKKNPEQLSQ